MNPGNPAKLMAAMAAGIFCAGLLLCAPAMAGTPGTSAGAFLKFTPSPRATAMGESYTSVTEDAYASYWNPAGLASVEQPELSATYNSSFEDVSHQYISAAYPLRYGSTLGLNISRLSVSPFQGYDATGLKTGGVESSDMAIGVAYGRTLLKDEIERPVFNAGVNLKTIGQNLDGATARTVAVDAGVMYYLRPSSYWMKKMPAQELRAAFAVRNLGPGLKFDKESFALPLSATLGLAWLSHPEGKNSLVVSLDQTIANDEKYSASLGVEYMALQLLALRAGYKTGQAEGSGARFGVGFRLSMMDVDYSMSPFGELGSMHKLGVSMRFGAPLARQPLSGATRRVEKGGLIAPKDKLEKLEYFAKDFLALADKDLAARRYTSAEENAGKAFNLEPALRAGEWGEKYGRLSAVNKGLRLKETPGREKLLQAPGEQAAVAHQAITAYAAGRSLKAFLLAQAALGVDQRVDSVYENLLYLLADLSKNPVRRNEILPKATLVSEKLKKAAQAFYTQNFDVTVRECEEVLLLDESVQLAWTRLGSAYYMMGDKEKARKAYSKALELDPGDAPTRQFMESQGWK